VVDAAGHRGLEMGRTGPPVTSRDGGLVAWATYTSPETGQPESPVVHVAPAGDCPDRETSQAIGFGAVVNGFLGDDLVFSRMFAQGAWLTDLSGEPRRIPDLAAVNGIDPKGGWVAGLLLDVPMQSAVLDPRTGDYRWQVPGLDLGTFSPDASMILPFRGRASAILRIGLDGTVETATAVATGDVMDPPYTLAARPQDPIATFHGPFASSTRTGRRTTCSSPQEPGPTLGRWGPGRLRATRSSRPT
jgi:hypothetical protein